MKMYKIHSLTIFWTLSFILISLLLVFYIFQVGVLTQKAYLIKDYEKKLAGLSRENEILEIEFSKLDSLTNLKNYLLTGNFVKANANQIKYIQILESAVVSK